MPYIDFVRLHDTTLLEKRAREYGQEYLVPGLDRDQGSLRACTLVQKPDVRALKKANGLSVVMGGTLEQNTFAVSQKSAHALFAPAGTQKLPFDAALSRLAADSGTLVALDLGALLRANGKSRALLLKNNAQVARLCVKYGAPLAVFSGAQNEWELRAAKDTSSVLCLLGLSREQSLKCVRGAHDALFERGLEGFSVSDAEDGGA